MTDEKDITDPGLAGVDGVEDLDELDRIFEDEDRQGRASKILAGAIVLLFLLLAGFGYYFIRVISPVGGPTKKTASSGLEWVRSIYGYGPAETQQFFRPTDTAVGTDGTIWGTDPKRARVLGFNPDGSFKGLLHVGPPAKGAGRMWNPEGIGVAPDGQIYLADFGNQKIMVFTADNKLVREWPVPVPTDVAVSPDNSKVYVTTIYGVAVFDTKGTLIATWGQRGKARDQFDAPHSVTVGPNGTVYVADTQNTRIKAYDAKGTIKWVYGSPLKEGAKTTPDTSAVTKQKKRVFQIPAGISVDGAGRVVVVDPFSFQIDVLDAKDGHVLKQYGEFGVSDGQFAYPTGIAYDPLHDWFSVADTNSDRLQIMRIPGSGDSLAAQGRRATTAPLWLCSIPLGLLLVAIAVIVLGRRRRQHESDAENAPDTGESTD